MRWFVVGLCVVGLSGGCSATTEDPPDAPVAPEMDARVPLPYACVSDDDCGGQACTDGHCPCASNGQCMPFLTSPQAACFEGFCVAACPYSGSPFETPASFVACDGGGTDVCCVEGERCCMFGVTLRCVAGDQPCE